MGDSLKRIILFLLLAALGVSFYFAKDRYFFNSSEKKVERGHTPEKLTLFVPGPEFSLKRKDIYIDRGLNQNELAEFLFEALKDEGAIPDETEILHFSVDREGTIYLDLSKEILGDRDSESEILKVYSIVNTFLENFKSCRAVQLLIEGEVIPTLSGALYTYLPLSFNSDILEGTDDKS